MLLAIAMQGLLFGLAYVAPIGTQNLYVINSAMQQNKLHIMTAVISVIFFDISLAIACYTGVGILLDKYVILREIILILGALVIFYIAIDLIRTNLKLKIDKTNLHNLKDIIFTAFAVTWFNPQAIIDGSLLLGSFKSSLPVGSSMYFLLGVCLASCMWFSVLAFIVHKFTNEIQRAVRYINIVCAVILIFYGMRLLYIFLTDIL